MGAIRKARQYEHIYSIMIVGYAGEDFLENIWKVIAGKVK